MKKKQSEYYASYYKHRIHMQQIGKIQLTCHNKIINNEETIDIPEVIEVEYDKIKLCTMISNMMDCVDSNSDSSIDLTEITPDIMRKVITCCEYYNVHVYIKPELKLGEKPKIDLSEWDRTFLNTADTDLKHQKEVRDIALAGNFLQFDRLALICCMYFTEICNSCTSIEQMREKLGIINDFTPEEEAENRRIHGWVDEC